MASNAGGTLATIGLRLKMPVADSALLAIDQRMGIDGLAIAAWLAVQPAWLVAEMVDAYNLTMPLVAVGVALLAVIERRIEAWRGAFCDIGAMFTAALISVAVPAKGLGVWFPGDLIARLPDRAASYAFGTFDRFRDAPDPLFGLGSLAGVITFPSFHTVLGLIILAMARIHWLALVIAGPWFILMMASTLPIGGHYVVDLLGGAALWLAWFVFSLKLEDGKQWPAFAPAAKRQAARSTGANPQRS